MPTGARKRTARRGARVTVHDVASDAGVSIATVSYVLNDSGSISDEVRKKVRKSAARLGYRQNRAARAMKMGRTEIIGLVIPNIENPFFATLAKSVLLECRQQGYQVFLVDTEGSHETELKAMQGLAQQGVDGIVVFPIDDSQLTRRRTPDIPIVVLDRDSPEFDLVQAEYREGGRLLAEHLLELGHTRFGLLDGPQDVTSARQRSEGFIEAVGKRGSIAWRLEHPFALELDSRAAKRLADPAVTAIVCGNDLIAMGAIGELRRRSVDVPGVVSIAGFDDIPFASIVNPGLTTVRMPIAQMGVEAVGLLARRLRSGSDEKTRSRIVLDVELIVRESTGPV